MIRHGNGATRINCCFGVELGACVSLLSHFANLWFFLQSLIISEYTYAILSLFASYLNYEINKMNFIFVMISCTNHTKLDNERTIKLIGLSTIIDVNVVNECCEFFMGEINVIRKTKQSSCKKTTVHDRPI